MRIRRTVRWAGMAGLASLAACAATKGSGRDTPREFTPKARLEAIAAAKLDARPEAAGIMVSRFPLEGPFPGPNEAAPHPTGDPFADRIVARADERSELRASGALACVARQLGRFWLVHGEPAARPIRDFVMARCGAQVSSVRSRRLTGEVPASVADADLYERWGSQLDDLVGAFDGRLEVGGWHGREGDQVVFVVAAGRVDARASRIARVDDATLEIEGRLAVPAASVRGFVTRGLYGYAKCRVDPAVALPAFRLRCSVSSEEPWVWVDLSALPPGRKLGSAALGLMVPVAGALPDAYEDRLQLSSKLAPHIDQLEQALLDAVGAVRERAGLHPLVLEGPQSYTARRLGPAYFVASKRRAREADEIALGLMAGWDVDAKIRSAAFFAASVSGTHDASALAASLLARPFGRAVLLDPEAERVALGPVVASDPPMVGTLVATYRTFATVEPAAKAGRVREALDAARAARGGAPLAAASSSVQTAVEAAAEAVTAGRMDAQAALSQAIGDAARAAGTRVRGSFITTSDLDRLPFADALLDAEGGTAAVAVGVEAPLRKPWARYVIFIVHTAPPKTA